MSGDNFTGEAAAWAKMYKDKLVKKGDEVPRGWRTSRQVASLLGKNRGSIDNMFRRWRKRGEIKSKLFRIVNGNRCRNVTHYFCESLAGL